ncbi:rhomboid family intramembrane serine protease [Bartonella sp. cb54]|uniref:rhomboid family intramembrane serine protease n=1 Tax=Bartonella sp. cb54 TaxID=3385560 RepID=UPI0039A5FCE8
MKDVDRRYNNVTLLSKQPRESLLNVPFIIVALIAACFCIYFIPQYFFSEQLYIKSLKFFSFTPLLFKVDSLAFGHTIISYSFMHGSFEHIAINMAWLLVFGSPLVRYFGGVRFLIFWLLTAVVSALTYFVFHQNSMMPLVGASGAVSGMMGAVARYSFFSIYFNTNIQDKRFLGSLLSIKQALFSRNVLVYMSIWLIVNFMMSICSSLFESDNVSVAWEAHIGGLFSGFLLVGFFDISRNKSKITI